MSRLRAVACGLIVAAALCPWISSWGWIIDLVANLSAQAALVTVVVLVWWLAWRRWRCAAVAGVALVMHLGVLVPGRAAWTADPGKGDPRRVVVLTYNAKVWLDKLDQPRRVILESDADVVGLVGALPELYKEPGELTNRLAAKYPNRVEVVFDPAQPWFGYWLLSRWSAEPFPLTEEERAGLHPLACIVRGPSKPFGVVLMRPDSPRTAARWIKGCAEMEVAGEIVRRMREGGYEVVLMGDLNSTPTGYRTNILRHAGLRRCKPWQQFVGTYPSTITISPKKRVPVVWPLKLAIDDLAVTTGVTVVDWSVTDDGGSDHCAARVGLMLP